MFAGMSISQAEFRALGFATLVSNKREVMQ